MGNMAEHGFVREAQKTLQRIKLHPHENIPFLIVLLKLCFVLR
jgi:hypothetical protein